MIDWTATKEILIAANSLIEAGHWCHGEHARDADGGFTWPRGSNNAVSWCATGAILAVVTIGLFGPKELLDRVARRRFDRFGIVGVNDYDGRDAVLSVYQEAITLCQRIEARQKQRAEKRVTRHPVPH